MSNELAQIDGLINAIQKSDDIDEIVGFRDKAKAVAQIARKQGLNADKAKEAQVRAEIRAGEWLGENVKAGNPQLLQGETIRLDDIGVSRIESHRWQKLAREYHEHPDEFEKEIARRVADPKEELWVASLLRAVWAAVHQTDEIEWWTPEEYIEAVHEVMGGIDLDPATSPKANETVGAETIYTKDDDGLLQPWFGRVFLNPPYGKEGPPFIAKLFNELGSTVEEAIVLVNSRATDADWFQPLFNGVLCFTDHRIDFDSPFEKQTSSTHGSAFAYFGPNRERFAQVFERFGNVVQRWP